MTAFAFIHGGFHAGWCWDDLLPLLPYPAKAVNLPGRRGSAAELGRITYRDWVESATAQVSELPEDDIVLVCHSLGGITAPQVAMRLAQRVRQVVFVAAVLPPDGATFFEAGVSSPDVEGPIWEPPPVEVVAHLLCNDMPAGSAEALHRRLNPEPTGPLRTPVSRRDMPAVEVTFIRGAQDNTGLLHDADSPASSLRAEFPDARLVTLPGGHNLMMSQPEALAAALAEVASQTR